MMHKHEMLTNYCFTAGHNTQLSIDIATNTSVIILEELTLVSFNYTFVLYICFPPKAFTSLFLCFLNQAHAWFPEITFVWDVSMFVCMSVCPPLRQ